MRNLTIYSGLVVAWFGLVAAGAIGFGVWQKTSLRPTQPIEFPHKIHVGELGMVCADCHQYPEQSIRAGLPDAKFCMGCHEAVATDRPEIEKLTSMYEAGRPVNWTRVYRVKPHVYFTHKRHVRSNIQCQKCHGPVEFMTTAVRVTDLGMGWCLDCHEKRGAPTDCDTCHK